MTSVVGTEACDGSGGFHNSDRPYMAEKM